MRKFILLYTIPISPDDEEKLIFRKTQKHIIDLLFKVREENKKIFLAHGRDSSLADKTSSLLGRLKLDYETLDFGQKKERQVKEFNQLAKQCEFAIIILSADDQVSPIHGGVQTIRVSQNVIFQFGYFLSHVGKKNMVLMYPENKEIESPIDFDDLKHAPMDSNGKWKEFLIGKLSDAGIFIDSEFLKNIL